MRASEWAAVGVRNARNARAWARDYAYAGRQTIASAWSVATREDPSTWGRLPPGVSGTHLPVLILPGIYETWRMLRPLALALRAEGHPCHVAPSLRLNLRDLAADARTVARDVDRAGLTRFHVVAHSKGGLVGRALMLLPEFADRIPTMVAIATPFSGSSYAGFFAPGLGVRSLAPRRLRDFAAASAVDERIVSLIPRWDPHIPDSCEVTGGQNVYLEERGHFAPIGSPRVQSLVVAALAAAEGR